MSALLLCSMVGATSDVTYFCPGTEIVPPASKHEVVPVWHVGPSGTTWSRSASPSQSISALTRCRKLPEVSPFFQYSRRDLDQNVTALLSSVLDSASSSMYPTMSTRPDEES